MASPDELARAWVTGHGLTPSPPTLAGAHRRVCAWGRLAQVPQLLDVPSVVRVDLAEHGHGPPYMAPGTAHARVWVEARSDVEVQRLASQVCAVVEAHVWTAKVLLTVEVARARWVDRAVARWRWRRWTRDA